MKDRHPITGRCKNPKGHYCNYRIGYASCNKPLDCPSKYIETEQERMERVRKMMIKATGG